MKISCPCFSSKLFTETNSLTFKQFISVSYKMCLMDIAENYALGFPYYKYKTLISLKIYVVLYQYYVVSTWSQLAGMKLCPALPGSRQCYKLFVNYILRLHVKRFIPVRRDHSFVQPVSRFAGKKFSHVIASAHLGGIKKLIDKYP